MTTQTGTAAGTAPTEYGALVSTHPATGAELGRYVIDDAKSVGAAVRRAREAQAWWGSLTFAQRRHHLLSCRANLAHQVKDMVMALRTETGKSVSDAVTEIVTCLDHMAWAAKNAKRVLGARRVPTSLTMFDHAAHLEYQPFGVVGVIGPWNYPLFTPMGSIIYALAAGNTVVFKPSEFTPGVGQKIADLICNTVGAPIVSAVHGFGDVGELVCRADVDKIAFTGSYPTAKKVAHAAADRLVPALIEGGGNDAAIVAADANLRSAASHVLWSSMTNAGQSCVGIERVYVVDSVADEFVDRLVDGAKELQVGSGDDAQIGPITIAKQLDVIRGHIDDALDRGGTAVLGGRGAIDPPYVHPTILCDVPDDSKAATEETFGPVLIVNRVADTDEALHRANTVGFRLGGAVFGGSDSMRLARGMRSGMVAINSGFAFAGIPRLPFGGVGASGYGRAHGDDGLWEFAVAKSIARRRLPQLLPTMTMQRKPVHNKAFQGYVKLRSRRRPD